MPTGVIMTTRTVLTVDYHGVTSGENEGTTGTVSCNQSCAVICGCNGLLCGSQGLQKNNNDTLFLMTGSP